MTSIHEAKKKKKLTNNQGKKDHKKRPIDYPDI